MKFTRNECLTIMKMCSISADSKVLLLERNDELKHCIEAEYPKAQVHFLQDVGMDKLIADVSVQSDFVYNVVFDDGYFQRSAFDDKEIRAIGLHLDPYGSVISTAKSWDEVMAINNGLFLSWFEDICLLCKKIFCNGREEVYFVKSYCCNAQVIWLQSYYSKKVRHMMSTFLTRIEFDIDVQENKIKFLNVCRDNNIAEEYIRSFISSVTVDNDKVFKVLGMKGYE